MNHSYPKGKGPKIHCRFHRPETPTSLVMALWPFLHAHRDLVMVMVKWPFGGHPELVDSWVLMAF